MAFSLNPGGQDKSRNYNVMWGSVFFLIIFGIVYSLYLSTKQIDYVWRWNRVPQYFAYQENVKITAEENGDITGIEQKDGSAFISIKTEDGVKEYKVPSEGLSVANGDLISRGDTLSSTKKWKAGILMEGLWLTLVISFISTIIGVFLGLITGLARISENPALKWLAITYIEIIRGSPLLVQIYIWYFVLGTLINSLLEKYTATGWTITPLWFGVASMAFFTGAYVAEIARAGIQSIHRGQTEAARSLGMTASQAMIHIILPQALRRILPPLAGQFISLIKDSSLLGIIAVRDLTKATREVVTTSLQPFELWFVCALLYLLLTFSLSIFLQYLERRVVSV